MEEREAEREAERKRARERAEQEAAQRRPNLSNPVTVTEPTVIGRPASQAIEPPRHVQPSAPPKAQLCERKALFLSGVDEAEGFPQPAHLQSYLAELRATIKAQMLELQC